jgi:hypothetical protein
MTEQTFAAIRSFLANRVTDRGYAVRFADARCRCGAAHFALTVNEDFGAAWMRCRACDTKYALHDPDTRGATAGSAEDSADECVCTCDADEFEVVAGVTLYGHGDTARTAYVGCRCVACGRIGCYASWPRVDSPFAEFFDTMKQPRE